MPDFRKEAELLNAPEKGNQIPQVNSVGDRLRLEANLLGGGLKDGFLDRLNHARENPGVVALEFVGAAALGAGLTAMKGAGGRWEKAACVAAEGLKWVAIADVTRRAAPTAYAAVDTMINPQNYLENRAVVARYAGGALFDYPLMMAGGYAGSAAVNFGPRAVGSMVDHFKGRTAETTAPAPNATDLFVRDPLAEAAAKDGAFARRLYEANIRSDINKALEQVRDQGLKGDGIKPSEPKVAHPRFEGRMPKLDWKSPEVAGKLAELNARPVSGNVMKPVDKVPDFKSPDLKLPELKIADGKPVVEATGKTIKPLDSKPFDFKPFEMKASDLNSKFNLDIRSTITTRMNVFPIIPLPTTGGAEEVLQKAKN